jgi:hypothetical protein
MNDKIWTRARDVLLLGMASTLIYLVWDVQNTVTRTSEELHNVMSCCDVTRCVSKMCRVVDAIPGV